MEEITRLYFELSQIPALRALFILIVAAVVSIVAKFIFTHIFLMVAEKTESELDDRLADIFRGPVVYSVLLIGAALAIIDLNLTQSIQFVALGLLKTFAVIIWGKATMKLGDILLEGVSEQADTFNWIQPKSLPLFEMIMKIIVVGGALYFLFISWDINVTSWLASAGILGIAIGFAAKDTLANLFSGIFILADAPYKAGDFIILDNGIRGLVTDIGIRSTRLLTRDDVEVTLPNAVIANSKIINETGGPHLKMRVRVKVSVAYGSDVDKVIEILLSCVEGVEHITDDPEPRVRLREFGDSGILFELLAWIDEPVFRGRVIHNLNIKVYKTFNENGIEIPYSKHDIYIKEQPVKNE